MEFVVIMTMIGIISLAGIVVNNAIVLIDYTNLLFERRKKELGMGEGEYLSVPEVSDCIAEAGKTRLRPVLLTAITTILGLVPLAIGLNIDFGSLLSTGNPQIYVGGDNVIFWGPMSWTIIFGLSVATFLTLVVTPVMYLLVNRLKIRLGRPIVKVS
jgi:multidrug efflux pump subunit AcrB